MKGTSTLSIIQYNINRSKNKVQNHFLQALNPLKHHVVASQELWRHPTENTTVTHPAYHLVFPNGHNGRTCTYISKSLTINKWRKERVPEKLQGDITSVSIDTGLGKIFIDIELVVNIVYGCLL